MPRGAEYLRGPAHGVGGVVVIVELSGPGRAGVLRGMAQVEPAVKVTASGPRDILLLRNQRDNATPWAGALGVARALRSRAGFVGVDNGGHCVYGVDSTCAGQATVAFLSQGTLPAKPLSRPAPTAS